MYIWIVILIAGILLILAGYIIFKEKQKDNRTINKSALIIGIFIPLYVAFSYSETLFEYFPRLTWIDVGGLYIIGMISGFFLAVYFMQKKKTIISGSQKAD